NWSDIVDAADWLRGELGVSKSLWDQACITMGRNRAAMALALITTKEPGEIKNPGGYFRRMLEKDTTGDLHLDSSFWGLRHTSHPDHRARPKGRSNRGDMHGDY